MVDLLIIIGFCIVFWIVFNLIHCIFFTEFPDWDFYKKFRYYLFTLLVPFGALGKDEEEIQEFIFLYFGDNLF